jgi:hydrogenase expression/formation protein HypC
MCLGVPGQVIAVDSDQTATVDFWGALRKVHLGDVSDVIAPGDYVISHAGRAVRRITDADINDTLLMYETMLPEFGGYDPLFCECTLVSV